MAKAEQRMSMYCTRNHRRSRWRATHTRLPTNLCMENFTLTRVHGCAHWSVFSSSAGFAFFPTLLQCKIYVLNVIIQLLCYSSLNRVFESKKRERNSHKCTETAAKKEEYEYIKTFCIRYYHTSVWFVCRIFNQQQVLCVWVCLGVCMFYDWKISTQQGNEGISMKKVRKKSKTQLNASHNERFFLFELVHSTAWIWKREKEKDSDKKVLLQLIFIQCNMPIGFVCLLFFRG